MVNTSEKKKRLIRDPKAKNVTFSKRRSGIFKKASELSTLCGAEVGIIIFSPTGKAYAFGNPSVETIINRYYSANTDVIGKEDGSHSCSNPSHRQVKQSNSQSSQTLTYFDGGRLRGLYKQYYDLVAQVEAEKKRGELLRQRRLNNNFPDINKMNRDELCKFKASLEHFKQFLDRKIQILTKN